MRGPQQRGPQQPPAGPRRGRADRAAIAALIMIVVLGFFAFYLHRTHKQAATPGPARTSTAPAKPRRLPAAESGLLRWHLRSPLSREVVVPGRGGLVVLGGLTSSDVSTGTVYELGLVRGVERPVGTLPFPVHDAAAGLTGNRVIVYGGGSPITTARVQEISLGTGAASTVGSLPAPRSDATGVTIGQISYVVGGYTGSRPDAAVLASTDGRHFATVANLPVPVRYPAVTALNGQIYVFGGEAATGRQSGQPVNVIQVVDPAHHRASVTGHLPEPLAGAAAVTLNGEVFLAGGESSTPQRAVRGTGPAPGQSSTANGTVSSSLSSVDTIWAFDPASKRLLVAGRLPVPVSHAGVAVIGSKAWIVGGESRGRTVNSVQTINPDRSSAAGGAGSP